MSEKAGSLVYDISADDSKLQSSLTSADKTVKDFGKSMSSTGENVKDGLNKVAVGTAVVGAGLTLVAKNATDFTVNYAKESKALGREIGVTTEEASRLTAGIGRMGISADQAQQVFGIFSKQIVKSTENAGATADAFSKLGVSTRDASGKQKDFLTILNETADKFKAMPDGIDKTALSMELFGRQGKDMVKVLNLGSAGIADLEKQADKLGLTLNSKSLASISKLVESQKDLKQSTDAMKISIGLATAPVLTEFNQRINDMLQGLLNADGPIHAVTVGILAFGGPILGAVSGIASFTANMIEIVPKMVAFANVLKSTAVAQWLLNVAMDANVVGAIIGGLALLVTALIVVSTHMDETRQKFEQMTNFLKSDWGTAILVALAVLQPFIGLPLVIATYWQPISQFFVNLWNTIKAIFQYGGDTIRNIMNSAFYQILVAVISGMANIIGAVAGGINSVVWWVATLPARVRGAIGNLGGILWDAGWQVMNGFLNGLIAGWSRVKDLVGGVASWVRAHKGPIDKDRQLLVPAGNAIMQGFHEGLSKEWANVQGFISGVGANLSTNVLTPSIGGSPRNNTNTVTNSATTVINIGQINNAQDENMVIRALDRNSQLEQFGMSAT